jgi:cytochrome c
MVSAVSALLYASVVSAEVPHPDPARGEKLFAKLCASCHLVAPSAPPGLAPNLNGVLGRKAGSTNFSYSNAMRQSTLTWTEANLDRFLAGPASLVRGTAMPVSVPAQSDRVDIVAFLARQ